MTKIYEEIYRGTVSQAVEHFSATRGEFTMVVAGQSERTKVEINADIEKQLADMKKSGIPSKEAIGQVAEETGLSRKELYQAWIKNK